MVNLWSENEGACTHNHDHSNHDGTLACNSIPQFDEGEVDRMFQHLNYATEGNSSAILLFVEITCGNFVKLGL